MNVCVVGQDRVLSPVSNSGDTFFLGKESASDDFMSERASQEQAARDSF